MYAEEHTHAVYTDQLFHANSLSYCEKLIFNAEISLALKIIFPGGSNKAELSWSKCGFIRP